MSKQSAGLLAYRWHEGRLEVFLVHPGGPFWAKKDAGAWSIPKGEFEGTEDPLEVAQRELAEETGFVSPGPFTPLGAIRQTGGKTVHAFATAGDFDANKIVSNTFTVEWPPRSGRQVEFPEVDKAGWFTVQDATAKLIPAQVALLARLVTAVTPP